MKTKKRNNSEKSKDGKALSLLEGVIFAVDMAKLAHKLNSEYAYVGSLAHVNELLKEAEITLREIQS